jgi:hypothetical protein
MKPSYIVIAAFIVLLAACAIEKSQTASRNGPWKFVFQDPTLVRDVDKFGKTLNDASSRWEKGMTVKKTTGGPVQPRPDHTNNQTEPTATVLSYPSNNQVNPDSLHVTQKVVLFNQTEKDRVIDLIKYHDTSSK